MLGPENKQFGQACVSQVTGTAAWMDVVSTQYLLGVRPTLKGLLIDPSIPSDWNGFKVTRIYRGSAVDIEVQNPRHVQHGVKSIAVNGKKIEGNLIIPELLTGLKQAQVLVIME